MMITLTIRYQMLASLNIGIPSKYSLVVSKEDQGEPILSATTGYNAIKAPFTLYIHVMESFCRVKMVQERINRNASEDLLLESFNQLIEYYYTSGLERRLEPEDANSLRSHFIKAKTFKSSGDLFNLKLQIDSIQDKFSSLTGDLRIQILES